MKGVNLVFSVLVLVALIASGCSSRYLNCQKVDFKNPQDLIGAAKAVEADKYSPDYLKLSEKELMRSKSDYKKGKCLRAAGWAERSAIDAELAKEYSRIEKLDSELSQLK